MAQEIKPNQPAQRGVTDPFGEMRSEMDRLLESMFGRGRGPTMFWNERSNQPSIDIKETDTALVLTAELPGIAEKDVHVTVRDGVLTLKGEKRSEHDETKDNMHVSERMYGSFQRAFRLPDTVDDEKIVASFDKGVLTVNMPKGEESKPEKRIPIGS